MSSFSSTVWRLALVCVLSARTVSAADRCVSEPGESPRERAKAEYGLGLSAYEARRYRDAIDHLMCASELVPSADLAYNIAVSYEAMGDAASSLRWYREYRRQGGADARAPSLLAKIAELEATLQARGVQQVTFSSTPSGATLRLDDQPLGLTPFTLELKPGPHRYRLSAAGHASAEGTIELRPDRSLDVAVTLSPEPRAAAPSPEAATAADGAWPSAPVEAASMIGIWSWVSLGAGTLLLGTALGVELRRGQIEDELEGVSQLHYRERYDSMRAHQTTARVLFGVGAAALAAGIVLSLLDADPDPVASELALASCAGGALCLSAGGAF